MRGKSTCAGLVALAVCGTATVAGADDPGLGELVQVLHKEGVLDDEQAEALGAKAAAKESRDHWTDRIRIWGDLRARYEGFFYSEDATGNERSDRNRARYRARLNVRGEVNDHVAAFLRVASGSDDSRSANQSFGSGVDFDTDDIRFDRAYIQVTPWAEGRIPGHEGWLGAEVGKVPNPFVWKVGKDILLWDHDISPEGVHAKLLFDLSEDIELFANAAYYVVDENSSSRDPDLFAGQIGSHAQVADAVRIGGRFSVYAFNDIDADFLLRSADSDASPNAVTDGGGSLLTGLTDGDAHMTVLSGTAYLELGLFEDWPILVYGTLAGNLDAGSTVGAGQEDLAWSIGLEVGDKKAFAKLGLMYAYIEANAFPTQFIDSNLFDGRSNRKGFAIYLSRQIWTNTDLNLTTFISDEIEDDVPPFGDSVVDAERVRLQADLQVKF